MPGKIILMLEDNPDDVDLAVAALGKHHLTNQVIVARDGPEALEFLLGPGHVDPAVVLLDIKLPKIDGVEVLKRLRSEEQTTLLPVVILTSSDEDENLITRI